MGYVPTVIEIEILDYLISEEKTMILSSASIADMESYCLHDPQVESYSNTQIRNAIKSLLVWGLVAYGVSVGRTNRYYVTRAGQEYLAQAMNMSLKDLLSQKAKERKERNKMEG